MNGKLFSCLILISGLLVLLSVPGSACADNVTWNLNDATFTDGATATGSFVYNADTNTVSSVDIVTSAGADFGGTDYTAPDPGYGPFPAEIVFVTGAGLADYTGTPALDLLFGSPLTDAGGTIPLSLLTGELTCGNPGCTTGGVPFYRALAAGDVTTAAVSTPEPSTLLLLGLGLLMLFAAGKRKALRARAVTL
jgi:hypothetical protein